MRYLTASVLAIQLALTAPIISYAQTSAPPLDRLGRCVNMKNIMRGGVLGDCDAHGVFVPKATAVPGRSHETHLGRIEQYDQENLFTDEERQVLVVLIKARMLDQATDSPNPTQETLLVKLQRNMPLSMGELTALIGIMTTSHNDQALAMRDRVMAKVREMRADREKRGYGAQQREQREYMKHLQEQHDH